MSLPKISFEVMVMFPEVLEFAIQQHNERNGTDFCITDVVDDDLSFCTIEATKYQLKDIFSLGYRLSIIEHKKRLDGELDW